MAPAITKEEAERLLQLRGDAYAAEIRRIYMDAERIMLEKVANRLKRGIDSPGWAEKKYVEVDVMNQELGQTLADLRKLDPLIQQKLESTYNDSAEQALKDIRASGVTELYAEPILTTRGSGLKVLISDTVNALSSTQFPVLRTVLDGYRSAVSEGVAQVRTGTLTARQAAQLALNKLVDNNVTGFVDSAGRQWDLASYVEMATRTANNNAADEGKLDTYQQYGKDLVIVSSHGNCCPLCAPWENKILSISGRDDRYPSIEYAKSTGWKHPNCRHTVDLYTEGLTAPIDRDYDPEAYKERQQQRYYERGIRHWKRRDAVALDPETKAYTQGKVKQWQAAMRTHIDNTGLRRDYGRESITRAR